MRRLAAVFALAAVPALAQNSPAPRSDTACAKLTTLPLDHAAITAAIEVPAATEVPGVTLTPARVQSLPAFCRVQITAKPSDDSDIKTEIWLPLEHWNGRYYGQGNGGFAGQIAYEQMAAALAAGYATSGTDTGHPNVTGDFALGHPEKVKDFGWRAIHETAVEAKARRRRLLRQTPAALLLRRLLGRRPRSPHGGPALPLRLRWHPRRSPRLLTGPHSSPPARSTNRTSYATPEAYIPSRKIPAIAEAVRNACDAGLGGTKDDGLKDGIITDPRTLRTSNPETLACKAADSDILPHCPSPDRRPQADLRPQARLPSGKQVYPGSPPRSRRLGPESWGRWKFRTPTPQPSPSCSFFANGYFAGLRPPGSQMVPGKCLQLDRETSPSADSSTAEALNATDPNLKPFFNHGGKLILYHGWNDPAIPAEGTIDYYTAVQKATGSQATEKCLPPLHGPRHAPLRLRPGCQLLRPTRPDSPHRRPARHRHRPRAMGRNRQSPRPPHRHQVHRRRPHQAHRPDPPPLPVTPRNPTTCPAKTPTRPPASPAKSQTHNPRARAFP